MVAVRCRRVALGGARGAGGGADRAGVRRADRGLRGVPQENDTGFAGSSRFVIMPMFLFSGHVLPGQPAAAVACGGSPSVTPLWHGVDAVPRHSRLGHGRPRRRRGCTCGYLSLCVAVGGLARRRAHVPPEAGHVSAATTDLGVAGRRGRCAPARSRVGPARPRRLVERNLLVVPHVAGCSSSGLLRAVLLPALDRRRHRRASSATSTGSGGRRDLRRSSSRPALLAAVGDERRHLRVDVQRLLQAASTRSSTTPCWPRRCARRDVALGEIGVGPAARRASTRRRSCVMHGRPGAGRVVVGAAGAAGGGPHRVRLRRRSAWRRPRSCAPGRTSSSSSSPSLPLFLFSTTFYPLSAYPRPLQLVVECTPLYHGIELVRGLVTGEVGWSLLGNAAYLVVMGLIGLGIGARRLAGLLLK